MRDRFRLSKRIAGASKIKNEQAKHAVFDEIALDIAKSMMTATQRAAQKPTIEYPEILPVSQNAKTSRKPLLKTKWLSWRVKRVRVKPLSYRKSVLSLAAAALA